MGKSKYLQAVFDIIECLIKKELLDTGKNLIIYYMEGSDEESFAGRARDAITRYAQLDIPTLQEIRDKSEVSELGRLDHLVLKMEYESTFMQQV
jgi:hypothetical protein